MSEHLGLPSNLAEQDACKVEHLVSDVTAEALALFLESRSVESKEREAQVHSLEGRIKDGSVDIFPSDRVQTLSSELEKNSSSTHEDNDDE